MAADVSLRGLKTVWRKKKISHKLKLKLQLYKVLDNCCVFNQTRRRFLHDSADTREVLPLDPVAQDGSGDVHDADLSAAFGDFHVCFAGKQELVSMSMSLFHSFHQI